MEAHDKLQCHRFCDNLMFPQVELQLTGENTNGRSLATWICSKLRVGVFDGAFVPSRLARTIEWTSCYSWSNRISRKPRRRHASQPR